MNGLKGISATQKQATLREYARAIRLGNKQLANDIRNANGKWISNQEFANAQE